MEPSRRGLLDDSNSNAKWSSGAESLGAWPNLRAGIPHLPSIGRIGDNAD
jgi:hypothetical protein